jgi:hypothetical protein
LGRKEDGDLAGQNRLSAFALKVPGALKPLPIAILEAKREGEDCLKGMQQAKGYFRM